MFIKIDEGILLNLQNVYYIELKNFAGKCVIEFFSNTDTVISSKDFDTEEMAEIFLSKIIDRYNSRHR